MPLQEKGVWSSRRERETATLPIMDLSSPDRISAANSSRQACADCGFFYLVNHGVEQELPGKVFEESKKIFSP
ncbi:hypothetical protein OIU77_023469 [Salix suchowensis]|uniref:Non-haem dioxygenase N-terminal domain-containing protein n=1 Tax=Salix suchowensis TaxID=1278906 RepID=A0ABQ9C3X9_9ROSI|nr:hypothetical protein OIU77_023469 [Salix suchowensis]